ncbi:putative Zinc finger, BED-type [Corchorus olitorius]|uniref:Zinc finger, BED-type n=1 Tax=Corchorus olitorius TaxID=93759 RepID=A0A1R3GZ64_9ROSI|nr:putative Zinc finger, BED-type [Corchorus olitorius]
MESENINVTLESATPITVEQDDDCVEEIPKFEAKQQGGRKKRKKTSKVWEVFQTIDQKTPDGTPQAKCKYCGIVLKYDSKFGTGNLLRHCETCPRRDTKDVKQMILNSEHGNMQVMSSNFDPEKLRELDSNFKSCPSKDEWDRIERLTAFLADFYEITCTFSGTKYPTANLYFPSIFMARLSLEEHKNGEDDYMKNMATRMFAKFEKYWSDFSLILAIAVTLDPRYKLQFVEYSYQTLYGENSEQFSKISATLYGLFNEYVVANASTSTSKSNTSSSASETQIEQPISARSSRLESGRKKFLKNYQSFESAKFGAMMDKSQLDLYLEEKPVKPTDVEELMELTEDIMKLSITKEEVASVQCSFAQD